MAEKAWMKELDVQGWTGLRCGVQGLKETCQLGGMNSLVSHWKKPSQHWLARMVCWDVVRSGGFCQGLGR